jgi:acyl carrier protein
MELQDLVQKLIDFFKENSSNKKSADLTGSSRLKEDLDLDSLDFVELVMKLEDEYEIKIADDDANKLQTIEDVACLIKRLKE